MRKYYGTEITFPREDRIEMVFIEFLAFIKTYIPSNMTQMIGKEGVIIFIYNMTKNQVLSLYKKYLSDKGILQRDHFLYEYIEEHAYDVEEEI